MEQNTRIAGFGDVEDWDADEDAAVLIDALLALCTSPKMEVGSHYIFVHLRGVKCQIDTVRLNLVNFCTGGWLACHGFDDRGHSA